jgi:hypothetical protein
MFVPRCKAIGCVKPVRREHLMCRYHWELVPDSIQRRVYAAYRPEQLENAEPSAGWYAAAAEAVEAVARATGKPEANPFRRMADMLAAEGRREGPCP